jgi:predicted aldo/keto reductase-like oxidoreductase
LVKYKIEQIQQLSKTTAISIASLCLNFANNNEYIDKIIVGVDSVEDLKNNVEILNENEEVKTLMKTLKNFSEKDVNILFPHFWKL